MPYLALLAVLHVTVVVLEVYVLVRRAARSGSGAVAIALIVLFFGSGFENLFWAIQIGFVGATALGLGALLLLDDVPTLPGPGRVGRRGRPADDRDDDLGVRPLHARARRSRRHPRPAPTSLDPAARSCPPRSTWLWYVTMGRSGIATDGNPFTTETMTGVPGFILDGVATAFGSAVGGGALVGRVVIVGLAVWVVYLAVHRRSIPRRAIACLLAIVAEYAIVGVVRAQLDVDASLYTRYAYLSGILALIGPPA